MKEYKEGGNLIGLMVGVAASMAYYWLCATEASWHRLLPLGITAGLLIGVSMRDDASDIMRKLGSGLTKLRRTEPFLLVVALLYLTTLITTPAIGLWILDIGLLMSLPSALALPILLKAVRRMRRV